MDYSLYQSWLSHEQRNGFDHGRSEALYGKPMRHGEEHIRFMPQISDKMAPESWQKLVETRSSAYNAGFRSVRQFSCTYSYKKTAQQSADSMKRNGYSVIEVQKVGRYEYKVIAATDKRELPYGAKL